MYCSGDTFKSGVSPFLCCACRCFKNGTHHMHPVPADKHSEINDATGGFSHAK